MRGESGVASPVIAATRSDHRPAQAMTFAAWIGPRGVARMRPSGRRSIAVTGRDSSIAPPRAATSRAKAWVTRVKSVIPVRGLHSARIPATWGSISRIRSGPTSSRPSTPLASPLALSAARRASSDSSRATTSLPGNAIGTSWASQYRSRSALPSRHRSAFWEPGT